MSGRLAAAALNWTEDVCDALAGVIYDRIGGFAYAHDWAIRLLSNKQPPSPFECVIEVTKKAGVKPVAAE